MMTVENGPISNDFVLKTPLIPIIFSHGYGAHKTMYSGFLRDIASHGYIVFSPDHLDGCTNYTVKKNGEEVLYYNMGDIH
jgi:hypothetical protein